MRTLTITRRKKFVASLAKVKVYLEDAEANDLVISGIACRLLGTLSNGQTNTWEIPDGSRKVFVIGDKLSKAYCNEFFLLPDDGENVVLAGENQFNPAAGNAFRFDGNNSAEVEQNRKKSKKIGWIVLIVAFIIGAIIGYAVTGGFRGSKDSGKSKSKTFTYGKLSITLTDAFTEKTNTDGKGVSLVSENMAIGIVSTEMPKALTLDEMADAIIASLNVSAQKTQKDDRIQMEFVDTIQSQQYHYFSYLIEHDGILYAIDIWMPEGETKLYPKAKAYADSIVFAQ